MSKAWLYRKSSITIFVFVTRVCLCFRWREPGIAAILYIYSPALTISYLAIIACREVGLVVLSRSSAPGSSGGQPANKADLSDGKSPPPPDKEKEKEKEKEEEEEPVIRKSDSLYKVDWHDDDVRRR